MNEPSSPSPSAQSTTTLPLTSFKKYCKIELYIRKENFMSLIIGLTMKGYGQR
jgi:hypothetical protein